MKDLKTRIKHQYEELDNPDFHGDILRRHLKYLRLLNRYVSFSSTLVDFVVSKAKILGFQKVKIVDIGCGGGDLLKDIATKMRKEKIPCELVGIDLNQNCIDYARSFTEAYSEITYSHSNVRDESFEIPDCDILISYHFLDHLPDVEFTRFLLKAQNSSAESIVICETERSRISYYLFKLFGSLLFLPKDIMRDCLNAIERAFTVNELRELLDCNGIETYKIRPILGYHWILDLNATQNSS